MTPQKIVVALALSGVAGCGGKTAESGYANQDGAGGRGAGNTAEGGSGARSSTDGRSGARVAGRGGGIGEGGSGAPVAGEAGSTGEGGSGAPVGGGAGGTGEGASGAPVGGAGGTGDGGSGGCEGDACGCPAPEQIRCDGACVDPRYDSANCGACGRACGAGEICGAEHCFVRSNSCGSVSCDDGDYNGLIFSACCAPGGGCGLDLSFFYYGYEPTPPHPCLALDAPGPLDPSCPPLGITFETASWGPFEGCCAAGTCGAVVTDPFVFGCTPDPDGAPCGP